MALARLQRALGEYELLGVKTTLPFLRRLVADEAFASGAIYTRFLENRTDLFETEPSDDGSNVLLAAALLSHRRRNSGSPAGNGGTHGHTTSSTWRAQAKRGAVDRLGGAGWRSTT
jgi:pyruvate carboxylase